MYLQRVNIWGSRIDFGKKDRETTLIKSVEIEKDNKRTETQLYSQNQLLSANVESTVFGDVCKTIVEFERTNSSNSYSGKWYCFLNNEKSVYIIKLNLQCNIRMEVHVGHCSVPMGHY